MGEYMGAYCIYIAIAIYIYHRNAKRKYEAKFELKAHRIAIARSRVEVYPVGAAS